MDTTSQRRRAYRGPALFSSGFRVFFLAAGLWAVLAMLGWIAYLAFGLELPSRFTMAEWHAHEMIFGYTGAVVAGFLLTATPNWTGRLPVVGRGIGGLFALWGIGRIAILLSEELHPLTAGLLDVGFQVVLAAFLAREIVAGKTWRNLPVVLVLAVLVAANVLFHLEAAEGSASGGVGLRLGVGAILFLILLIGGRVVPSFTRNWMARMQSAHRPQPTNRFDLISLVVAGGALIFWVVAPETAVTRGLCLIAGVLHLVRLSRWLGWRTLSEPMLVILHLGYLFAPVGFLMIAASDGLAGWAGPAHVPHAWTAGTVGVMTLAMTTRVSLAHTGRPPAATRPISLVYFAVIFAACLRIGAEIWPSAVLWNLSAGFWIAAFAGFVVAFLPILTRPRL